MWHTRDGAPHFFASFLIVSLTYFVTFTLGRLIYFWRNFRRQDSSGRFNSYMSFVFTMSYAIYLEGYTILFSSLMYLVISFLNEGKSLVQVSQTNDAFVVI